MSPGCGFLIHSREGPSFGTQYVSVKQHFNPPEQLAESSAEQPKHAINYPSGLFVCGMRGRRRRRMPGSGFRGRHFDKKSTNKQAERFSGGNCLGQSSEPERNEENKFIFIRIMGE